MVSERVFMFHMTNMGIPCGKTFSLVRSSVGVNIQYQGHIFQKKKKKGKMAITGTLVFHLHGLLAHTLGLLFTELFVNDK